MAYPRLRSRTSAAAAIFCLGLVPRAGAELAPRSEQAANLNYDVTASLMFIDGISRPGTGVLTPLAPKDLPASAPSRALGLGAVRAQLTWQAVDSASLNVVLRPDAANRAVEDAVSPGRETREFDTRAGDSDHGSPYRPAPTIRLLDAYQLDVAPGAALSGSFGVFEELAPRTAAYPLLLGFGLETSLPAKFSGARLIWRKDRLAQTRLRSGLSMELTVLQGDEDRAEGRCDAPTSGSTCSTAEKSLDRAPSARDPYQGFAVETAWRGESIGLNLVLGTFDATDMVAAVVGRRTEVFGKAGAGATFRLLERDAILGFDVRYVQERWRVGGVDVRPRLQHSEHLSLAWSVTPLHRALLGAQVGHSDRDPQSVGLGPDVQIGVNGYQVDAGYLTQLGKNLDLQLMLSHERRESKADGRETGAIYQAPERGGDRKTLRRMGLSLTYQLNDNA